MTAAAAPGPHGARIGPNAITRVAAAMRRHLGRGATTELFQAAGLGAYLATPPERMVDEAEVQRLHALLRRLHPGRDAALIAREAGADTAEYLLAHRIPRAAQALLRRLPARWALRLLLAAVARHAWTFAGSGRFQVLHGPTTRLVLQDNPLCRGQTSPVPLCDYYAATFERLLRRLVHARVEVVETQCEACGDAACVFEVRL